MHIYNELVKNNQRLNNIVNEITNLFDLYNKSSKEILLIDLHQVLIFRKFVNDVTKTTIITHGSLI
ncbi:hypothetical protein [Cytobacillus gottheilii]|uniref:hypothetical protein n=1 Tax=Cytobacillus gottheilii TaxID=859144 RepID=UPI001C59D63D|nr:hypothetical protein [Cytobacillus gottheilii]